VKSKCQKLSPHFCFSNFQTKKPSKSPTKAPVTTSTASPTKKPSRAPSKAPTTAPVQASTSGTLVYSIIAQYDKNPGQTSMLVRDAATKATVFQVDQATSKDFPAYHRLVQSDVAMVPGRKYEVVLKDSGGDVFCCESGKGHLTVQIERDGQVIWKKAVMGDFTTKKTSTFKVPVL